MENVSPLINVMYVLIASYAQASPKFAWKSHQLEDLGEQPEHRTWKWLSYQEVQAAHICSKSSAMATISDQLKSIN